MGKIIAIGGGEIGRPQTEIETELIDKEIIAQTGKKNPRLLFIPTASSDSEGYISVVEQYFGKRLGCEVTALKLLDGLDIDEVEKKVMSTDIIYVGGGNTYLMLKAWKRIGFDRILFKAFEKGIVLSGVSAGAVCWFNKCLSDYKSFFNPKDKSFNPLKCLGFVKGNLTISPHQIRENRRLFELMKHIDAKGGVGLALDDMCALEIKDDKFRLITSTSDVGAYRVYKKLGFVHCERMKAESEYKELSFLFNK
jgi:dipeptidase E